MKLENKKLYKNLFFGIIILFFLIFSGVRWEVVRGEDRIGTSVNIINSMGPDAVFTAIPEKRIPNILDRVINRSTILRMRVYPAGADRTNPANILFSTTTLTSDSGTGNYLIFEGLTRGENYDIAVKGYSHLTKVLPTVFLQYFSTLDFTNASNSPLKSGDINLAEGDDKINALDVSILVDAWNTDNARADLNQDTKVNSIDISNLLANFNVTGD